MNLILLIIYALSLAFIFVFSLVQLHLTYNYLKSRKHPKPTYRDPDKWPYVTVQLPVYNEKYVVARLLKSVLELDYPSDRIEIQVLDDSTDETSQIIRQAIKESTVNIVHLQRKVRTGYKAGALEYGLDLAKGEFIAVFDADFIPKRDFLKKTIPVFHEKVGLVQTRWGHLNKNYSLLTALQAFGLDAHFTIEQSGRKFAGSFISFNGTGGIWRKSCIKEAGGWSAETLTEDLDLSYRAQLKGWEFRYLEDYEAPAELPIIMSAIKSQQYRWNKGAAETARKILPEIMKSRISFTKKLHATFHLLNSSVFVFLFIAGVLSIPMLYIKQSNPQWSALFIAGSIFLLGFFSIGLFYWVSSRNTIVKMSTKKFLYTFPMFLIVSMGLSLHNALAVVEGLFGRKTAFIRTPKFNVSEKKDRWLGNVYVKVSLTSLTILEGLLFFYFLFGIWAGISLGDGGMIFFHAMLALGFGTVFFYSINPFNNAAR